MSVILRYFPLTCDFPYEYTEFNSLQELLNIKWVRQFAKDEYFTHYFVSTFKWDNDITVELKSNHFNPNTKERYSFLIGTFKKNDLPKDVYNHFRKWLDKDYSEDLLPAISIQLYKMKNAIKHLNFQPQPFTPGMFCMMLNQLFKQFKIGKENAN